MLKLVIPYMSRGGIGFSLPAPIPDNTAWIWATTLTLCVHSDDTQIQRREWWQCLPWIKGFFVWINFTHVGWPCFKKMVWNIAVIGYTENRQWLNNVWSCLGLMIGDSLMSSLCPGYPLQMLGELLARMVQFVHGFQYPHPLVVPTYTDSGLSLVTCFGQWDQSICNMSRNLKSACTLGLVLLVCLKSCHQA